ncbi:hypothetical protein CERZMDRAFT_52013 [Cercospora zeae-maydis SCOH1-5]|uniref:alcohol O-acetyltransferase n=1 Tax=Cercospora zeae-maydis SCOH1-5 TaxID=717836 RepID=A0A6A6F162_9PEZI|nr:hypothetical protein CERZMDRAFT_52013 [Cercospora zeae-maydis SCOH1-5]
MAFSWFPGACSTTYTHAEESIKLPTKNGPVRALSEICKDVIPPCNLNPLLFNGHLQTAWTAMKYDGPAIHYKRRVFEQEDRDFQGHFTVDFVTSAPATSGQARDGGREDAGLREDPVGVGHNSLPPRTTYFTDEEFDSLPSDDSKPLLITLHGLSGGSYETYLRHVLEPLVKATAEGEKAGGISGGNWEALVVNSRGCAGSKITTSILYNARATWDVRQIVKWARKTWPNRPLYGIGYSLGANILTNYLGEEGDKCLLHAAVVVSNPWKLEVSNAFLQSTYIGLNVYSKTMGTNMLRLFNNHKEQITKNTSIKTEEIEKCKYLHDFDRVVQCATWGYPTEGAYYRDASSSDSVLSVRIPLLCVHAVDDPIACDQAVPYAEIQQNPYAVMCATSSGGHLGWFEFGGGRWHTKPALGFLEAMRNVDFDKIEAPVFGRQGPHGGHETPFVFDPMRRKSHRPAGEQ